MKHLGKMITKGYKMGFVVVFSLVAVIVDANEPVYYVSLDHANITYFNPEYYTSFSATSNRLNRWDPKYYVQLQVRQLKTIDNNITVDAVFYEFRSNEYRRGFVEMHFRFCDMFKSDNFFGPALRANLPACPIPPGSYDISNMSIPDLPFLRTFPFRKGRIYITLSARSPILEGYTDMEIKEKRKLSHKSKTTM